jgi:hypothetical integral membrane protein (TIGR02206 family)
MLSQASAFRTFGPSHLAAMALIALAAAGLPALARKARSPALTRGICWAIALGLLGNEFTYYVRNLVLMTLADFARNCLPIHICGAAVYLTAWVMVKRSVRAFEIAYFWGLGGTVQAILTPNILEDFPAYWFIQYFTTHGLIVVGVVFAALAMGMRPARGAVPRVVIITNVFAGFVALADWALGANYMFLRAPPAGASPFFFLPWPWYILFLEGVALAIAVLLYLPFALRDRRARGLPSLP